jgi:hypothetical protein
MTPLKAAKEHCANYQPNGSCLGIAFRDDLSMYPFRKEGLPCLLRNCEACPYFEQIILPQVPPSVAEQYRKSLPAGAATTVGPQRAIKLCPDCRKREVESRKRYCATCAKIRKRKSKRQYMREKRGLAVEKTAFWPIGAEALMKANTRVRYHHPQTSISDDSFSTGEGIAQVASEDGESIDTAGEAVAP